MAVIDVKTWKEGYISAKFMCAYWKSEVLLTGNKVEVVKKQKPDNSTCIFTTLASVQLLSIETATKLD